MRAFFQEEHKGKNFFLLYQSRTTFKGPTMMVTNQGQKKLLQRLLLTNRVDVDASSALVLLLFDFSSVPSLSAVPFTRGVVEQPFRPCYWSSSSSSCSSKVFLLWQPSVCKIWSIKRKFRLPVRRPHSGLQSIIHAHTRVCSSISQVTGGMSTTSANFVMTTYWARAEIFHGLKCTAVSYTTADILLHKCCVQNNCIKNSETLFERGDAQRAEGPKSRS